MAEQLYRLPWQLVDGDFLVEGIVGELTRHWSAASPYKIIEFRHGDHFEELMKNMLLGPDLSQQIYEMHDSVEWGGLAHVNTHGNCHFSNCMMDEKGNLVLGPSVVASHAIPDLQSSDYGIILASIMGWDYAWHGDSRLLFSYTCAATLFKAIDDVHLAGTLRERNAAHYWAVFHTLRSLPGADDGQRERLIMVLENTLDFWKRGR